MADTYVVERSLRIDAAPQVLFDMTSNFRNWEEWSPWEELDPNMEKRFHGDDGSVGSGYSWKGNRKAGQGRMTISELQSPNRVAIDLRFEKPFKSQSVNTFELTPEDGGTNVTWTMTGSHNWMSKIMGVFMPMDKLVGKDFEKGLAKLKAVAEK